MRPSVAVLGAGTLGEIVIEALLRAGWPTGSVTAMEKRPERAAELADRHGIVVAAEVDQVISPRQVVVVVVKPNDVPGLLAAIGEHLDGDHLVLALAAGVPIARYEAALPGVPVVRSMPNTPAAVGKAMTAFARGTHAGDAHVALCREILTAFGAAVEVPEESLDAVTAVSGSGPAYVFLLAEAMERAAVELGLSDDVARLLVQQTIDGAGSLLAASPSEAADLRRAVTSPGGTTAAALEVFDKGGFDDLVLEALKAAAARSVELGAG